MNLAINKHRSLASLLATSGALLVFSCSGDDTTTFSEALSVAARSDVDYDNKVDVRNVDGDAPVYAMMMKILGDDTTSYVYLSNTTDVDEISLDDAREFPGWAVMSALGGGVQVSGENADVTRYEITEDLKWEDGETISFANAGSDGGIGYPQDATTSIVTLETNKRIIWEPSEMVIKEIMEKSNLPKNVDGYEASSAFLRRKVAPSTGTVIIPFQYYDPDSHTAPFSKLVAYDPQTHEERKIIDAPCGSLGVVTHDEKGNAYFSAWWHKADRYLFGLEEVSCTVRVKPDLTLDEDFTNDFLDQTSGRPVTVFRYVAEGLALGNVVHHELTGLDYDEEWTEEALDEFGEDIYYPWVFDLENDTATQITGVPASAWSYNWSVIDGHVYILLPNSDWDETKVFEIDMKNAKGREVFTAPGWLHEWHRVR